MAIAELHQPADNTQKLLATFAHAQLAEVDTNSIKQNSFQLFAIAAFLYGAISQLGKQSTQSQHLVKEYVHNILCEELGFPRHTIEGLVSSISRMMDEYYLLENIYHEGEAAAENWLTHDEADCLELKNLLDSYRDFTLMDMKAAGMKSSVTAHAEQFNRGSTQSSSSSWPIIFFGGATLTTVVVILYYFLLV